MPNKRLSGFAVACALCLWGAVEHYGAERTRLQSASDPYFVEAQRSRLAGVLAAVPPQAVVGYVTNVSLQSPGGAAAFQSARYTLAPRLLVADDNHPWVLGNFSAPQDFRAFGARQRLDLVQDFGNGV